MKMPSNENNQGKETNSPLEGGSMGAHPTLQRSLRNSYNKNGGKELQAYIVFRMMYPS